MGGPVNLQLNVSNNSERPEGPVLRLFMHHDCCVGLEQYIGSVKGASSSGAAEEVVKASYRIPRVKQALQGARDISMLAAAPLPAVDSPNFLSNMRGWKNSSGKPSTMEEARRFATARDGAKYNTLAPGEYK